MRSVADAIVDDRLDFSIHPAIDHALSWCAPTVADRAEEVIRTMLAERWSNDGPDAWGGSRLTGDGFHLRSPSARPMIGCDSPSSRERSISTRADGSLSQATSST